MPYAEDNVFPLVDSVIESTPRKDVPHTEKRVYGVMARIISRTRRCVKPVRQTIHNKINSKPPIVEEISIIVDADLTVVEAAEAAEEIRQAIDIAEVHNMKVKRTKLNPLRIHLAIPLNVKFSLFAPTKYFT